MPNEAPLRREQIQRIVNYYTLKVHRHLEYNGEQDPFIALCRLVIALANNKDPERYTDIYGKKIFVQNVAVDPARRIVKGLLRSVRLDLLPEFFNVTTDETRALDWAEDEGVVETTHFLIDYAMGDQLKLSIEYNYQGAKLNDLVQYLGIIGVRNQIISKIYFFPIVKNDLEAEIQKFNRCSEFIVKIHTDRIEAVRELDEDFYLALNAASRNYDSDYTTLVLKYDYKKAGLKESIRDLMGKLANRFRQDPNSANIFETVTFRAENPEKGNKLEFVDMLVDKLRSVFLVLKNARRRTVNSEDMFDKMYVEMRRLNV